MISVFMKSEFKAFGGILALLLMTLTAWGQPYKAWNLTPSSGNFSSANWLASQTPGAGTASLTTGDWPTFGNSTSTILTNDTSLNLAWFVFNGGSSAYTFSGTAGNGNTTTISGGIVNNGSNPQTFKVNMALMGNIYVYGSGSGPVLLYPQANAGISGAFSITASSPTVPLTISNYYNTFSGGLILTNGSTVNLYGGSVGSSAGAGDITIYPGGALMAGSVDVLGYYPNNVNGLAPNNVINIGGTITDSGTASYRVTLPNMTFQGGWLTNAPGNNGDNVGQYLFYGKNGTNVTVTSLATNISSVIGAGKVSLSVPATFNIALGTVPNGVDMLLSSVLDCSVYAVTNFTKTGTGLLALTATNPTMPNILISAGTLAINGAGQLGTNGVFLNGLTNNGVFAYNSTANQALSSIVSGAGSFLKTAASTLTFSNVNTFTGPLTISNGTLAVSGTGQLGGGNYSAVITNNGTLAYNSSAAQTLSGVMSGSGTLRMSGANTLTLSAQNTYSGGTIISNGTVVSTTDGRISAINGLGAGSVTIYSGATLMGATNDAFGYNPLSNLVPLNITNNGGTITTSGSGVYHVTLPNLTFIGGLLTNNPGMTGDTYGPYNLNGDNNTATVTGLASSNTAVLAPMTMNLQHPTIFNIAAGTTTNGADMLVSANLTIVGTPANALTTKSGTGVLSLTGSNIFAGPILISAGTLAINGAGGLGTNRIFLNGVTNNGTFIYSSTANQILGGVISGSGTLTKSAVSTLTLTNVNTFTGPITNSGGTLTVTGSGQLGGGNYANVIANNAAFNYGSSANQTLGSVISGTGSLTQSGASILTLTGVNTFSGATTISAGTLAIGGAGQLGNGSYANTIANNGAFSFGSSANQTLGGIVSGTGSLTQNGSGTLTLTNVNTFSGTIAITSGTLAVSGAGSLGSGNYINAITNNGIFAYGSSANQFLGGTISGTGTLQKTGSANLYLTNVANTFNGPITVNGGILAVAGAGILGGGNFTNTIANNSSLFNASSSSQTWGGVISGTGAFVQSGSGTLTLTNQNTFTGPISIVTGTLAVGSAGTLGNGIFTNTIANGSALIYGSSANQTLGGLVSGIGSLTQNGPGTLTLTNANSFNGPISITNGTLAVSGAGQLGGGGYNNAIVNNGVFLDNSSANMPLAGAISGTGSLVINGSSTMTLSGTAKTFTGSITVGSSSTLYVGDTGLLGSGNFAGSITNNYLLGFQVTGSQTLGGTISGSGNLIQQGAGSIVTLTNQNTYTGYTYIYAGTLALSGAGSVSNSSSININGGTKFDVSTATTIPSLSTNQLLNGLGATGTINGSLNVGAGKLTLNYTNGTPTLLVTNGAFAMNNNLVTVNVSGTPLPAGVYHLVTSGTGGSVTGSILTSPLAIGGAGLVAGTTNWLAKTGTTLDLMISNIPVVKPMTISATKGINLKIALTDVATNWSENGGGILSLAGINLTSTNGVILTTNNIFIFYNTNVTVNDQINYTVKDAFGFITPGVINLVVNPTTSGQINSIGVTAGAATLNFSGVPGYTYAVQVSTNLSNWTTLRSTNAPSNGQFQFVDPNPPQPAGFYRLSSSL